MSNIQRVTVALHNGRFHLTESAKIDDLNPKALILCAAAECAGYTIMNILQKEHITPKSLEITAQGTLNTSSLQPISQYEQFEMSYRVECRKISEQSRVSEAVVEAHNEKCGVIAMLRKIAPVSHDISVVSTETTTL